MTLAEHNAALKAEGRHDEVVAHQRQQDAKLRAREIEYRRAQAPLLEELRIHGYELSSIWDLVNINEPYPELLPILRRHLQQPYPPAVREGVARAMGEKGARFAWPVLLRLFRTSEKSASRTAAALAVIADAETAEDVMALATDHRHGSSRLLLLSGLERRRTHARSRPCARWRTIRTFPKRSRSTCVG